MERKGNHPTKQHIKLPSHKSHKAKHRKKDPRIQKLKGKRNYTTERRDRRKRSAKGTHNQAKEVAAP